MKIGLLLPSVFMSSQYRKKIFAPKKLFLQLADGLVERGHEVYVYSAEDVPTKAKVIGGETYLIEHTLPSLKFRDGSEEMIEKMAAQFTKTEFELGLTTKAYAHGVKIGLDIMHSYHDYMAHYISKLVPFPTVYSLHDPPYPEGTMEEWRLKQFPTDQFIPISQSHRDSFSGKVRFTNVIYHGVNPGSYELKVNKKKYFAFMGRYLKEKGVAEALEAAIAVDFALHLAGDNAYKKLEYYQKELKPLIEKGRVVEVGFMDGQDKNEFLGNAKAFLFPIKWEEPFGMVMLEAMACGTPVVAFNRGSVSEIVVDGKTGFLVDPETGVEGFIKAVRALTLLSDNLYTEMVHNCRQHVEDHFSIETMVGEYEKLYKKVTSTKR